jgi:hypothetical protein
MYAIKNTNYDLDLSTLITKVNTISKILQP